MSNKEVTGEVCPDFSEQAIKLIIARLEASTSDVFLVSGKHPEPISKKMLIEHVRACDEVGKEYIRIQFEFFKAIRDGSFMQSITPDPSKA